VRDNIEAIKKLEIDRTRHRPGKLPVGQSRVAAPKCPPALLQQKVNRLLPAQRRLLSVTNAPTRQAGLEMLHR